jgi:hypothetical protein
MEKKPLDLSDPSLDQGKINKLRALGATDEGIKELIALNPERYLIAPSPTPGDWEDAKITFTRNPRAEPPSLAELKAFYRWARGEGGAKNQLEADLLVRQEHGISRKNSSAGRMPPRA